MSKYDQSLNEKVNINPLVEGENVIIKTKPKKSAFILNRVFTMMPIALIWLTIDSFFIFNIMNVETPKAMLLFFVPFFALHLMPVWIWLGGVITASRRWKNTTYYVTDKRIIIENGFIAGNFQTLYYKDISNINLKIGIIDKILGVGDIYFESNSSMSQAFFDVENVYDIYPTIQKTIMDIQTDIEYPNAYRPEENPGYNTTYNNK